MTCEPTPKIRSDGSFVSYGPGFAYSRRHFACVRNYTRAEAVWLLIQQLNPGFSQNPAIGIPCADGVIQQAATHKAAL
jgi:hypothetical protein